MRLYFEPNTSHPEYSEFGVSSLDLVAPTHGRLQAETKVASGVLWGDDAVVLHLC